MAESMRIRYAKKGEPSEGAIARVVAGANLSRDFAIKLLKRYNWDSKIVVNKFKNGAYLTDSHNVAEEYATRTDKGDKRNVSTDGTKEKPNIDSGKKVVIQGGEINGNMEVTENVEASQVTTSIGDNVVTAATTLSVATPATALSVAARPTIPSIIITLPPEAAGAAATPNGRIRLSPRATRQISTPRKTATINSPKIVKKAKTSAIVGGAKVVWTKTVEEPNHAAAQSGRRSRRLQLSAAELLLRTLAEARGATRTSPARRLLTSDLPQPVTASPEGPSAQSGDTSQHDAAAQPEDTSHQAAAAQPEEASHQDAAAQPSNTSQQDATAQQHGTPQQGGTTQHPHPVQMQYVHPAHRNPEAQEAKAKIQERRDQTMADPELAPLARKPHVECTTEEKLKRQMAPYDPYWFWKCDKCKRGYTRPKSVHQHYDRIHKGENWKDDPTCAFLWKPKDFGDYNKTG